jgi:hypothetical protein
VFPSSANVVVQNWVLKLVCCIWLFKFKISFGEMMKSLLSLLYDIYIKLRDYLPDHVVILADYFHVFRRFPNLKNPKRYTEKIQCYKLYGGLEKFNNYVDKYEVRSYVAETVGENYLIPLIGVWDDVAQIDMAMLPEEYVLKVTHGSGFNIIRSKSIKVDEKQLKATLMQWQKVDFYKVGREKQYEKCKPRILAEKYLNTVDGELLDYKFFCFNGEPLYVQVDSDRHVNHKRAYYDLQWKRLPFTTYYQQADKDFERPSTLEEMIVVAKKLSQDFRHVRVDLYQYYGQVYFGELTFTHGNGLEPFYPDKWDTIVGESFLVS